MQSDKFNFQRQQEYNRDLVFLPLQDLKKYKGFVYKVYSSAVDNMKKVFDHPLNQEALDKYYAEAIIQEVKTKALPAVTNTLSRFTSAQNALEKLGRIPFFDKINLNSQLAAIHQMQLMLDHYKRNLLKPLITELQHLQKNKGNNSSDVLCTDHLEMILQRMDCPDKELCFLSDRIGDLLPGQQPAIHHALLVAQASEEINCMKYLVQEFLQVNSDVVYLVLQWKNTKSIHEQQQVLN